MDDFKTVFLHLRVTPAEKASVECLAVTMGTSKSDVVRGLLFGADQTEFTDPGDQPGELIQLEEVGEPR